MAYFANLSLLEGIAIAIALQFCLLLWLIRRQYQQRQNTDTQLDKTQQLFTSQLHQLHLELQQGYQTGQHNIHEKIMQGQLNNQQLISEIVQRQMTDVREQMSHSFKQHASSLSSHLQTLTEEIRNHLHSLTQQVNHKLTEGFEKTSSTFTDVVKRLTIIDEAQKKLLSYLLMSSVYKMS